MKKILLLCCLTVILHLAHAQDVVVGQKIRKTFKIGFNLSPAVDFFLTNSEGINLNSAKLKFGYGLTIEHAFTNNYALVFGVEHKMAGSELKFSKDLSVRYLSQNDKAEYQLLNRTYRLDYINLPISLKLMTNEIGYFTYFGQFGMDFSILAGAKGKDKRQSVSNDLDSLGLPISIFGPTEETDFKPIYANTSFANIKLRISGGFEWNFSGNTSLVVSLSYHNGFIDVLKDSNSKRIRDKEGLYHKDSNGNNSPFEINANLHHVGINLGLLF